jgi:tRNA (mo5U34)-methyltransferase
MRWVSSALSGDLLERGQRSSRPLARRASRECAAHGGPRGTTVSVWNRLPSVEAPQLRERIAEFPWWNYRFEFDNGVDTPVSDLRRINRQEQRRRYFFEPLLRLTNGSLRGRRVLDLGCNAGFWALNAVEADADFVLGVDIQQEYLEQAELVFEAKGIDRARYRFERADILAHEFNEQFDLVLCLGLMDHLWKPVELFERMASVRAELIVIDTEVSRARSSLFEVSHLYAARNVPGDGLVLIPSRQAVADLAKRFGFDVVALALNMTDYAGMEDYRRERRLAFICSKGLKLSGLPSQRTSIVPWWLRDPRALTSV